MFRGGMGQADVDMLAVEEFGIDSVHMVRCDSGEEPKGSDSSTSFSIVLLKAVLDDWQEGVAGASRAGASGAGIRLQVENLCLVGTVM